jgi:NCS1 family nucleobase:cation symporter-1
MNEKKAKQTALRTISPFFIITYAPGAIAIILGLLFAFLAPWSTDITANAPPLIDLLMNTVHLKWKNAVLGAAICAFFVAPWWAVSSAPTYTNYFTNWASNYGILLGPIAGPMIYHFFITYKKNYDVQKLYTYGEKGFWYSSGFSIAGIATWLIVFFCGEGLSYVWPSVLQTQLDFGLFKLPWPGGPIWYFAVVASFLVYWVLSKALKET